MGIGATRYRNGEAAAGNGKAGAMRDSEIWGLLSETASGNPGMELRPSSTAGVGITYRIGGINVPADQIKRLADQKVVEPSGTESFASCPKCGSMQLSTAARCPGCHEQALTNSKLVLHRECGQLTPAAEAAAPGTGGYVCPKCGKGMQKAGDDYEDIEGGFRCLKCNRATRNPQLSLACEKGHTFQVEEQSLAFFPVYRPGKELQMMPRVATFLTAIRDQVAKSGSVSLPFAEITGESGTDYVAPLLVPWIPPLLADFILDGASLDFQTLHAIRRSVDVGVRTLLLVRGDLYETVRGMVDLDRITVVAFDDEAAIPGLARDALLSMRSNPQRMPKPTFSERQGAMAGGR